MTRKVLILLTAAFLAWNFANPLVDALTGSLPTVFTFSAFLKPANLLGQGLMFYFRFVLALAIWFFVIKFVIVLSGFGLPRAQKYATTKFFRRIQGAWTEFLIVGFFFLLLPLVFLVATGWPNPIERPALDESLYDARVSRVQQLLGTKPRRTDRASIYVETIKAYWVVFLTSAVILWGLTTRLIKSLCVALHNAVLLKFIEVGRFGQGGSARFAGLIEEWSLRYEK